MFWSGSSDPRVCSPTRCHKGPPNFWGLRYKTEVYRPNPGSKVLTKSERRWFLELETKNLETPKTTGGFLLNTSKEIVGTEVPKECQSRFKGRRGRGGRRSPSPRLWTHKYSFTVVEPRSASRYGPSRSNVSTPQKLIMPYWIYSWSQSPGKVSIYSN